jgi:hypothetical protein
MMGPNDYFKHAYGESHHRHITYIWVNFPEDERAQYPWGIAWVSGKTTEGIAQAFISTLPSACMPQDPADFVGQFLTCLQHEWKKACFDASKKVEELVSEHTFIRYFSNGQETQPFINCSEATRSGKREGVSTSSIGLPGIHSLVHVFGSVCNHILSSSMIWSPLMLRLI